jgi:hypothetical protein
MHGWELYSSWIAAGTAVITVAVSLLGILVKYLREIRADNKKQLAKQEKFERTWEGEDADYPGGPRKPGMVERVTNIENNTRGIPERMLEFESRLGKHDGAFEDVGRRLTDLGTRLTAVEAMLAQK